MSIFISVAAYCEPELQDTISSAVSLARYPDQIHVGVFEQSAEPTELESSPARISYEWVDKSLAQGAGWARSKVQEQFDDEDFFLQIDAHTIFTKDWDARLISWYSKLPNTLKIISGWPLPYKRSKSGVITLNEHESSVWPVQEPHYTVAKSYARTWIGSRRPLNDLEFKWSAIALGGFVFSRGSFVKDVPYDPRIAWTAEEFLLSARAFDFGYDIFGINEVVLFHNYARHGNARVWDEDSQWGDRELSALKIQSDMLNFQDESEFRFKNEDRVSMYLKMAGIPQAALISKNSSKRVGNI